MPYRPSDPLHQRPFALQRLTFLNKEEHCTPGYTRKHHLK